MRVTNENFQRPMKALNMRKINSFEISSGIENIYHLINSFLTESTQ